MDKFIELLQQIQELAGVAIDALKGAEGGDKPDKGNGPPQGEGGPPPGGDGGPPPGAGGPPPQR